MALIATTSIPGAGVDAGRNRVGQQQRAPEADARRDSARRAQRQRVIRGVDARQRDVAQLAHDLAPVRLADMV